METRKKIIENLIRQNCFWSYDKDSIRENIDDSLLIEHTLLYADIEDLFRLFIVFDKNKIQKVWEERILQDSRFIKRNHYLGNFFFNVKNVKDYIEQNRDKGRYRKIKRVSLRNYFYSKGL